jgi:hypothetical protein
MRRSHRGNPKKIENNAKNVTLQSFEASRLFRKERSAISGQQSASGKNSDFPS